MWCSGEGDGARPAEARHPRSARTGGRELSPPPRIRGRRRAGRSARGRRARDRGSARGADAAPAHVRAAADEPADRELRDRARSGTMTDRPRIAVAVFPGSNDDRDAVLAPERLGADASRVWHAERDLPIGTAGVVLPGGFSYGDYLRCGAIARFSPIMRAVQGFAADGGLVLGIC